MPKTDIHGSYDRFSKENFLLMEQFIFRCITAHKLSQPTFLHHPSLQPITLIRRLRDSIKTFCNSDWTSPYFTQEECFDTFNHLRAGGNYTFSYAEKSNRVYCGPARRDHSDIEPGPDVARLELDEYHFDAFDEEIINAVLLLKNHNHIPKPIRIVGRVDPEAIEAKFPNVAVVEEDNNIFLIT